jgi:hypothetical protein
MTRKYSVLADILERRPGRPPCPTSPPWAMSLSASPITARSNTHRSSGFTKKKPESRMFGFGCFTGIRTKPPDWVNGHWRRIFSVATFPA